MEELDAFSVLIEINAPPLEVLQLISKYYFAPNVAVALHILLTLSVPLASGERSFSLSKLMTNYRGPSCHKNDCLHLQR
jgi:hypothetical protein